MSDDRVDPPKSPATTGANVPAQTKAARRNERLAQQLRENLKKRKELARSRKSGEDEGV